MGDQVGWTTVYRSVFSSCLSLEKNSGGILLVAGVGDLLDGDSLARNGDIMGISKVI